MYPRFLAEVSSNHNQSLERCIQFIDESARIGCDGVKFQLFKVDHLFAPEVFRAMPDVKKRRNWELPLEYIPVLAERCRKKGLDFVCTPFYLDAVKELQPYVDYYKIASYELLWDDLLIECAKTGKPIVLSTGMATIEEIKHAVQAMISVSSSLPITILHCVSGYPVPPEQCNLAAIQTLRKIFNDRTSDDLRTFNIAIGWSDHSVSAGVIQRAIHRYQASLIEFHLDLDEKGAEFDTGHCWLPDQISQVIKGIREAFTADGSGIKKPVKSEIEERNWRADPKDGLRPLRSTRNTIDTHE